MAGHAKDPRIADRIRDARNRKMWTQAELAQAAGVSTSTVSYIESGRVLPHRRTCVLIAEALAEDAYWLWSGDKV